MFLGTVLKWKFIAFFFSLLGILSFVASAEETRYIITVKGLTGYISKQGQEAIPPRFFDGLPFCEGLAAVMDKNKSGYISPKGEWAIPPRFDESFHFLQGQRRSS